MADRPLRPPRVELGPGLEVPRVLTGLWQVADMERDGKPLDPGTAGKALGEYADAGFDAFDMADHYGSAEILVGRYLGQAAPGHATAFTKWCPLPGPMTPEIVREGVRQRLDALPGMVRLRGDAVPLEYEVDNGEATVRVMLREGQARRLTSGELPELDRPVRFAVVRGGEPPLRAATLPELKELLRRPPVRRQVHRDRGSPRRGGRRR